MQATGKPRTDFVLVHGRCTRCTEALKRMLWGIGRDVIRACHSHPVHRFLLSGISMADRIAFPQNEDRLPISQSQDRTGIRRIVAFFVSPYMRLSTAALLWSGNFVVGR